MDPSSNPKDATGQVRRFTPYPTRSRRSMDRMLPSEGSDAGSIPAESTNLERWGEG